MCEEDYRHLVGKLKNDRKYNSIGDRYDRMAYLVKRRVRRLAKFGERLLEKCAKYQQIHRKSRATADYYFTRADFLFSKWRRCESFTESNYADVLSSWDKALLYLPIDLNDWTTMLTMMQVYVRRAQVEFHCGENRKAMSDLGHASSVLASCSNPEVILAHFNCRDQDLLITMLSLKTKLLAELDGSNGEKIRQAFKSFQVHIDYEQVKIKTREDVKTALETIRSLDLIVDQYIEAEKIELPIERKLLDKNYDLTSKVRLNHSENGDRSYVATEHIAQGEDILCERTQNIVIFKEHLLSNCNFCHRAIVTFWPCTTCTELVFCSAQCSSMAFKEYHSHECGIFGLIMDQNFYSMAHVYRQCMTFGIEVFMHCEDHEMKANARQAVPFDVNKYFDSDTLRTSPFAKYSKGEMQLLYRALASLISHRGKRDLTRENAHTTMAVALVYFMIYKGKLQKAIIDNIQLYSRLLEHLATAMHRISTNGFAFLHEKQSKRNAPEVNKLASCIFFGASFLNHSCNPNVEWLIFSGGKIVVTAKRAIEPGEQLNITYGPKPETAFDRRQTRLFNDYCFHCHCVVCMKDAANREDTLQCQSPNSQCGGPLVMNQFEACLECGYQLPHNLSRAKVLPNVLKRSSNAFMRTYQRLYQDKSRFHLASGLGCLFGRSGDKPEEVNSVDESFSRLQESSMLVGGSIKRDQITASRIVKLVQHFDLYSSVIYEASYHLLEKCILLLKVFQEAALEENGFFLIKDVSRCLEHIYPEMTDSELVKLVYMLDYAALFYEHLAKKSALDSLNAMPVDRTFVVDTSFWSFCTRLNAKLVAILQYDFTNRGDFFPELSRHLQKDSSDQGDQDLSLETQPDSGELFFRKLYLDCLRRLQSIEQMTNPV